MSSNPQCEITPISAFQSTNLSTKVNSFGRLSDRILRSLGYPFISVELHRDQLFENISIACEMFTKFAGYTQEYLLFDSKLYETNKGIRLDTLFTLKGSDSLTDQASNKTPDKSFSNYIDQNTVYCANSSIPGSFFTGYTELSAVLSAGTYTNEIFSKPVYDTIVSTQPGLSSYFTQSIPRTITQLGSNPNVQKFNNAFDYDLMEYRKVIAITDFEQGSTTGVNTLFTIEQTLAQQTYFSYAMGNYGFDLISWYVLKDWLENREKLLAIKPSFEFDERTQYLRLYPQPGAGESATSYYGVVRCYVERPIRDVIKEPWVYQYALALSKIVLARTRGKFLGTTLFGGGQVNADMLQEGLTEKEKLEEMLYSGAAGMGDGHPPIFLVG